MPEWLTEPRWLVLLTALAAGTIVVGRIRREPPLTLAANTFGVVFAWAGTIWAAELGMAAFSAAVLVGVGLYLMTTTYERSRTSRKLRSESDPARPAGVAR